VKYLELGELFANLEFTAAVEVPIDLVWTERLTGVSALSSGVNPEFKW